MHKFGQVLTPEEVVAIQRPSPPWVEPTAIQSVPTPEEMVTWTPDPAPECRCFRWEQNVQTGERKAIELTLDEYRARHVAKIESRNAYVVCKQIKAVKAKRAALLEKLLDELEAKV